MDERAKALLTNKSKFMNHYGLFDHTHGFICAIKMGESDDKFSEHKNRLRLQKAIKLACAMVNEEEVEIKSIEVEDHSFRTLSVTANMYDGSTYECQLYECEVF
jgi:hypothetical protein